MKTKAHAGPHCYDCMSQPPSPLWAGLPTWRKSPGRAGQGFQCQLFPTGTTDRASAPGDVQHKQRSSCRQANGLFSVDHSERTRGTEHQLKYRELRLNTEIDIYLWEVVRCSNWLPREAVECPRLQILKIPWNVALSSPLQLSPLWAGGGTKWFPEVPATLSPCCSSLSLEETQGVNTRLAKIELWGFRCFPTCALQCQPLVGKTGWKWTSTHFFLWMKKISVCQHTLELNEIKEISWPAGCTRELENNVVGNKTRSKD